MRTDGGRLPDRCAGIPVATRLAFVICLVVAALFPDPGGGVRAQSKPRAPGLPDPKHLLAGDALVAAMRGGGYSILVRHAVRAGSLAETDQVRMGDCGTQDPLSAAGRGQSRSIGVAMHRLGIPIGEAIASPFCRTLETAHLIVGAAPRADDRVVGRDPGRVADAPDFAPLARLLDTPPPPGSNRLVVGHLSAFAGVAGNPYLLEGEAGVFRSAGGSRVLVARLRAEDWHLLVPGDATRVAPPPSSAADALLALDGRPLVTAMRYGGYTLYIRHPVPGDGSPDDRVADATACGSRTALSVEGAAVADRIGAALKTLGVTVNEVVSGPHCRAVESARRMVGPVSPATPVRVDSGLAHDSTPVATRTVVAAATGPFGLRILVGDGDSFTRLAGGPGLAPGEAAVLRAGIADRWVVIARVPADRWDSLIADAAVPPPPPR